MSASLFGLYIFRVDRIVRHMIETLEASGRLKPGGLIVENSSGNTAAAVAMICAERGYRCVLIVPSKCSSEKQAALRAFGAKVLVTPPGMFLFFFFFFFLLIICSLSLSLSLSYNLFLPLYSMKHV